MPEKPGHNRQARNGFYDRDLNVVFLHSAGVGRDDGTIWVFRYAPERGKAVAAQVHWLCADETIAGRQ